MRLKDLNLLISLLFLLIPFINLYAQSSEVDSVDIAISEYTKAIKNNPKDAMSYTYRGAMYIGKGNLKQAISDCSKAIEINPQLYGAYLFRGDAYNIMRDFESAISDYNKAIEIDPKYADPFFGRGRAYYEKDKKGNLEQALSDCTKAIELNPRLGSAYYGRSVIYFKKNDYDKCWEDVNKAIEFHQPVDSNFLERLKKASGREK